MCAETGTPLTVAAAGSEVELGEGANMKRWHQYAVVGFLPAKSLADGTEPEEDLLLLSNPQGTSIRDVQGTRYAKDSTEWRENAAVREWVVERMLAEGGKFPKGVTSKKIIDWRERPSAFLLPVREAFKGLGTIVIFGPRERREAERSPYLAPYG
uniref:Uncharacterized protein n=1 Tax=Chromera velia CCMP2878 TaxID=1169474 RepID=A0A0K6S9A6_9ALVE|eukprot:Cvel_27762.t1-p1 / transcript=Cvel_27762.t1 / gene=Cvel_27762 / organism=Chromera_velia_CCMP2878 / gene_product=hypothetical protein / transcript_product=hypothetical protein / location=Cvel_scaffold3518:15637-16098(-) / protein_length=154 / sequence_SO=supercontig / SO=protein_coding / is_pseudo=false